MTLKKSPLNASTSADTIEILATSIVDASGIGNADYSAIKTFQGKANTSNTVSEYSLLPLQTAVTEMKRASETFVTQKDGEFTSSGGNPSQSQETRSASSCFHLCVFIWILHVSAMVHHRTFLKLLDVAELPRSAHGLP